MISSNDNNLFFLCSLIEFIGRQQKLSRNEVVSSLGIKTLLHIYDYADILHCEPIEKVADEYIELCKLRRGNFDNVTACKYTIPSFWDIGKVYSRLIRDVTENIQDKENVIKTLNEVYRSWISDSIANFNSDFFYQPHDYIKECYLEGKVL